MLASEGWTRGCRCRAQPQHRGAGPRKRPGDIDDLAEDFEGDGGRARGLAGIPRVPLERHGLDAISSVDASRPRALDVHDRLGVVRPQVSEHGLQGAIVAEVARAEEAEQANPGRHVDGPRAASGPAQGGSRRPLACVVRRLEACLGARADIVVLERDRGGSAVATSTCSKGPQLPAPSSRANPGPAKAGSHPGMSHDRSVLIPRKSSLLVPVPPRRALFAPDGPKLLHALAAGHAGRARWERRHGRWAATLSGTGAGTSSAVPASCSRRAAQRAARITLAA